MKNFLTAINAKRLINRINELGKIGIDSQGRRTRLALDDSDKLARDKLIEWMKAAGLRIIIDKIGNIIALWENDSNKNKSAVMTGSHIDTVINAGQFDGCYGVIAGLEVIQTLKEANINFPRPLAVAAFTNEEGVRYSPDMLGSLVYAGGMTPSQAHKIIGIDKTILGDELARINYAGTSEPGCIKPHAFIELHIEQGPILDSQNYDVGAVENLQGISWQKIIIEGVQNHAGTTPILYRQDAGLAAAKIITFLRTLCENNTLATVGCIEFQPNAINVIPSRAILTADLRNPDENLLCESENKLANFIVELEKSDRVKIFVERLSRFKPVIFDSKIVELVEKFAAKYNLKCRRITSGAGQDAQNMALICPTAMIFAPSKDGISHNPREFTSEKNLISCANVLFDVIQELAKEA